MIHTSIKYHNYRAYTESPDCIVVGQGFYQDKLYKGKEFHSLVSSWLTEEDFIEGIQQLNGFYTIICTKGKRLFATVDRVRSIPIFYGQKGNDFYLSDSADWVRQQVGNQQLDPLAKEEFLLTGYVTGPDTLFPDVKQIQAGECIFLENTPEGPNIKKHKYFKYIHNYPDSISEDKLLTQHDEVLLNIFNRLIQIAAGRTIVIPLSGGYDSRLIILMLKRLGYDKVIALSYGRPNNSESLVSKRVADSLGIRWEFVEYSNDLWYQWYRSEEYAKYSYFADGCASLPHIQDWPAVWQLKKNNKIPQDSIFVPGHSADLPAGSRSASVPELYTSQFFVPRKVENIILRYHYSLFDWTKSRDELEPLFIDRIKRTLGNIEQFPDGASAFESWDIAERQAKFIINSLRVYEFWGYEWWMPFWDYEYMQFWCGAPLEYRINQAMYKPFVDSLFYTVTDNALPKDDLNLSFIDRLKGTLSLYISAKGKAKFRKFLNSNKHALMREYNTNLLAIWGIVKPDEYIMYAQSSNNVNSILVQKHIRFIRNYKLT